MVEPAAPGAEIALEALPFAAAACDARRRVSAVNRRLAARMGESPDALIGLPASELFEPAGRLFFETVIASRLALGLPCEDVAMRLRVREGAPVEVLLGVGADAQGGLVLCLHERDAFRRFESELAASRARLLDELDRATAEGARRMQGLREIAHDLRSPLNAIRGLAEFALREPFGPLGHAKYRAYLNDIKTGADALDALAVGAIGLGTDAAGAAIPIDVVDPRVPAARAIRALRPILRRRRQRLAVSFARGRPRAHANAAALERVLLNVLSNASKFTPLGGGLELAIRTAPDALKLRVGDSGDGIPPEVIARIGQAFLPTRRSADAAERGSGLGLAIAAKLMAAMGGRLTVERAGAGGSTILLSLAAAPGGRDAG